MTRAFCSIITRVRPTGLELYYETTAQPERPNLICPVILYNQYTVIGALTTLSIRRDDQCCWG